MSKTNLFDLTKEFIEIENLIYNDDASSSDLLEILECLEMDIESKADNYAYLIKKIKGDVNTIEAEITRLRDRKKTFENKSKILTENLKGCMRATNKLKFQTALHSFNLRSTGKPSVYIENENQFLNWCKKNREDFLKYKEPEINKEAIKEAITEDGEIIDGVELRQSEALYIR